MERRDRESAENRERIRGGTTRRRRLLAALGTTALAGCLEDDEDDAEREADHDAESEEPPFELRTVDAPGSEDRTAIVPGEDRVTFLNATRLMCPTSEGLIETIADARDELESRDDITLDEDVRFVSLVDPRSGPDPTPEELADWWVEHGGEWTIGIDEDGSINDHYEISGFPTVLALGTDDDVHWRDTGGTGSSNMVTGIERALEAAPDVASPEDDTDGATDESDD
ncbi:thioredoxin domain-containing protein [Natronococcus occultus]|uniref:Thioredoxin domain-containing protein n=1 Tax=Natronococcus occultus SP4 TaxID=694430 RepID=L0JVS7_9EURY|nr:hypothetical protein [Natronococcus occultus]AGB36400.1 hypothetical protein Natoc_0538 [Natronococcus occultus SP4]